MREPASHTVSWTAAPPEPGGSHLTRTSKLPWYLVAKGGKVTFTVCGNVNWLTLSVRESAHSDYMLFFYSSNSYL